MQTAWQDAPRTEGRDAGFASLRWNPADWEYDVITLPRADAIKAAYTALATEARGMDPEEALGGDEDPAREARWKPYFESSIDAVIAVSRELTRRVHARIGAFTALPLTDDFVAVVCDPSWGEKGEESCRGHRENGAHDPIQTLPLFLAVGGQLAANRA